jgi:hypothetical protein
MPKYIENVRSRFLKVNSYKFDKNFFDKWTLFNVKKGIDHKKSFPTVLSFELYLCDVSDLYFN